MKRKSVQSKNDATSTNSNPIVRAARLQVNAACIRREALQATGRLAGVFDSGSALGQLPTLPNYEFIQELQRGGQGVVYLARQISTERQVAVKYFHRRTVEHVGEIGRFEREVRVLSRVKHPHVVTIHDCGRTEDDVYLVMDFVAGPPLDLFMSRVKPAQSDALELFAKICDGVNAAHLLGVIHRDLKPGNIRVSENNEPRVLDFGMAKLTGEGSESTPSSEITLTGQFVGSLCWASPEQAEGRWETVDVRTDVYSLGVMFYQLLTGRFPYPVGGRMDEVVRNIVQTGPARPSAVNAAIGHELETILLKCLAKEQERRYQNAGELARDFRRYLSGDPIDARRDSFAYVLRKRLQRHRTIVAVAGVLGVALLVASAAAWVMFAKASQAASKSFQSEREARQSEGEAKRNLGNAYLAEARALRAGKEVGHRAKRLDLLAKAATLIDSDVELRNEAIAALVDDDFILEGASPLPPGTFWERTVVRAGHAAFGSRSGQILVRSPLDGTHEEFLIPTPEGAEELAQLNFSPDGRYLVVTHQKRYSKDASLRVWDVRVKKWLWELAFPDGSQFWFDVHSDSSSVAVAWLDRMVRYHRLQDGEILKVIETGFQPWRLLHVNAGAAQSVLAIADRVRPAVALWNPVNGALKNVPLPSIARCMAQSPDGQWLAIGCHDSRIRVFRVERDEQGDVQLRGESRDAPYSILSGHNASVSRLCFSADSVVLYSWGDDQTLRLWDVARWRQRFAPLQRVTIIGVEGQRVVLADEHNLGYWRLDPSLVSRTVRARWEKPIFLDDRYFGVVGSSLSIWDWNEGTCVQKVADGPIRGIRILGNQLLALTAQGLEEWRTEFAVVEPRFGNNRTVLKSSDPPLRFCITPDERVAFISDFRDRVLRVPLDQPSATREFVSHLGARPMHVSSDGRRLVVGHWRGERVAVYSIADSRELFRLETPGATFASGAFVTRSDGSELLVIAADDAFHFFDSASFALRRTIPRVGWLAYFSVSPDGRAALVNQSGGTLWLVDLFTFDVIAEFTPPEPNSTIGDTAFSPNGDHLIVTTNDPTSFLWDLGGMRQHLGRMGLDW